MQRFRLCPNPCASLRHLPKRHPSQNLPYLGCRSAAEAQLRACRVVCGGAKTDPAVAVRSNLNFSRVPVHAFTRFSARAASARSVRLALADRAIASQSLALAKPSRLLLGSWPCRQTKPCAQYSALWCVIIDSCVSLVRHLWFEHHWTRPRISGSSQLGR